MHLFLIGTFILIAGYFTYGKFVEKVLAPDGRRTPALRLYDGIDYVVLPHWKNMLIQLLNIAGIGPVIGVILGIKFGSIVFILIPLGNIFGGAVHDFVISMISARSNGANLPYIVKKNLGKGYYAFFSVFVIVILMLVVAVFINVPASMLNDATNSLNNVFPQGNYFWLFVVAIFIYYLMSTVFPIDKIIGRFYPFFGGILLVGTIAIFFALLIFQNRDPMHFMVESKEFMANLNKQPILPCLFVTIACGILSGFHGTQSPIVVRTMATEREVRSNFYGMMIAEGVIAMIWAAAAMAIYNINIAEMSKGGTTVLSDIVNYFLGSKLGVVTILAVVILAITSGDTALRCTRMMLAEMFHIPQKKAFMRILVCVPLIIALGFLLYWSNYDKTSFNKLWNYFAWGNQVLAVTSLMASTVWLIVRKKNFWITLLPGMFMTFIVVTYIIWNPCASQTEKIPFGLNLHTAYLVGSAVAVLFAVWVCIRGNKMAKIGELDPGEMLDLDDSDPATAAEKNRVEECSKNIG